MTHPLKILLRDAHEAVFGGSRDTNKGEPEDSFDLAGHLFEKLAVEGMTPGARTALNLVCVKLVRAKRTGWKIRPSWDSVLDAINYLGFVLYKNSPGEEPPKARLHASGMQPSTSGMGRVKSVVEIFGPDSDQALEALTTEFGRDLFESLKASRDRRHAEGKTSTWDDPSWSDEEIRQKLHKRIYEDNHMYAAAYILFSYARGGHIGGSGVKGGAEAPNAQQEHPSTNTLGIQA